MELRRTGSSWARSRGVRGMVCDAQPLQSSNFLRPRFVCRLSGLLDIQLCRGLIFVVEGAEISAGGCFDDRGKASLQEVLWKKAYPDCVLDHCLDAWSGCHESSQVCGSSLRETGEESFKRPLHLVVDFYVWP